MQKREHWETVYSTKASNSVSWFQEHADTALALINDLKLEKDSAIIDVGGGASTLVDDLLARGYDNLTVLDLSQAALDVAKQRIGLDAMRVQWLQADITDVTLPENKFDLWHDRAVFHFLITPEDRAAYIKAIISSVKPDSHIIISTFDEDGPTKCSGLPVVRYSVAGLQAEFGDAFQLCQHKKEIHNTPFGTSQQFVICHFIKNF